MSTPNIDVYCFEDALEVGVGSWLLQNGMPVPNLQRGMATLTVPRVELKCLVGAWEEQYWVNPVGQKYLYIKDGVLLVRIATSRGDSEPSHARLRGMARWCLQDVGSINGKLTHHYLHRAIENPTTPDFGQAEFEDRSTLSFQIRIGIKTASLPQD